MIIVDPQPNPATSIELDSIWFNVADDMTDSIAFHRPIEGLTANVTAKVEVRELLGGRRRAVRTGDGVAKSYSVSLPRCTRIQVAWLDAHVGVTLCVRDHVGTKIFGIYNEVPRDIAVQYRDWLNVKLSIESVTRSEAV